MTPSVASSAQGWVLPTRGKKEKKKKTVGFREEDAGLGPNFPDDPVGCCR